MSVGRKAVAKSYFALGETGTLLAQLPHLVPQRSAKGQERAAAAHLSPTLPPLPSSTCSTYEDVRPTHSLGSGTSVSRFSSTAKVNERTSMVSRWDVHPLMRRTSSNQILARAGSRTRRLLRTASTESRIAPLHGHMPTGQGGQGARPLASEETTEQITLGSETRGLKILWRGVKKERLPCKPHPDFLPELGALPLGASVVYY